MLCMSSTPQILAAHTLAALPCFSIKNCISIVHLRLSRCCTSNLARMFRTSSTSPSKAASRSCASRARRSLSFRRFSCSILGKNGVVGVCVRVMGAGSDTHRDIEERQSGPTERESSLTSTRFRSSSCSLRTMLSHASRSNAAISASYIFFFKWRLLSSSRASHPLATLCNY